MYACLIYTSLQSSAEIAPGHLDLKINSSQDLAPLRTSIYDSIRDDFGSVEECWDIRARQAWREAEKRLATFGDEGAGIAEKAALAVYEVTITITNSTQNAANMVTRMKLYTYFTP
jgi:hypothetical protein